MQDRLRVLAYAGAHFGKSLLWHCSGLFFAFYLTEVAGFSPRFTGAALAASLVLNACCDLCFGALLGRWVRDLRAAAIAQAIGAVAACQAFLAFAALPLWPEEAREIAAVASLLAFRVSYSLLDVPQNTILAFISDTDAGRVKVASLRYMAAGAALLAVTLALAPWLTQTAPEARAGAFLSFASVLAPVTFATSLVLWWFVARLGAPEAATAAAARAAPRLPAHIPPPRRIGVLLPLASILIYASCMPLYKKLEAYFVAYAEQDGAVQYFMVAAAAGQVAGQFVWMRLASHIELIALYRCAAAVLAVVAFAFVYLAPMGGPTVLLAAALMGAVSSGLLATIWALLAGAAASAPAKSTLRFGQLTFCSKLAQAGSAFVLGEVLNALNYTDPSQRGALIWIMVMGPLLTSLGCSVLGLLAYGNRIGHLRRA